MNHDQIQLMQGAISRRPLRGPYARPLSAHIPAATVIPNQLNNWYGFILPTYSQKFDSCVGHGWANWLECVVRYYVGLDAIPKGMQLDGDRIWRYARKQWWGGSLIGGIYVDQGFQAMKALGWIPADSMLVEIGSDFETWNTALERTPLVQGHAVNDGWVTPSRVNGCLEHIQTHYTNKGGHCTLGVAAAEQDGRAYRALLNSWGPYWGFHGMGLMSDEFWLETSLDDVTYTAEIPNGLSRLARDGNWREALIKTPFEV